MTIVERLRALAALKVGDPFPEWLGGGTDDWGPPISTLAAEAADEIERWRALTMECVAALQVAKVLK